MSRFTLPKLCSYETVGGNTILSAVSANRSRHKRCLGTKAGIVVESQTPPGLGMAGKSQRILFGLFSGSSKETDEGPAPPREGKDGSQVLFVHQKIGEMCQIGGLDSARILSSYLGALVSKINFRGQNSREGGEAGRPSPTQRNKIQKQN